MRQVVLVLGLFLTLAPQSVSTAQSVTFQQTHAGQATPQCDGESVNSPILFMCIDWVDPASGTIAGWWLDLRTHQAPTGVVVLTPAGMQTPQQVLVVPRPDVAAYFGLANQNLGFGLIMGPMTTGTYAVETSDIPWSWDCAATPTGIWCGWIAADVVFTVS